MKFKFTLLIAILGLSFVFSQQKHTFQYDDKTFFLDEKPFQIIPEKFTTQEFRKKLGEIV